MTRFRLLLAAGFFLTPTVARAMSDNCGEGYWCDCRPRESQCLAPYATCEEACNQRHNTGSSSGSSSGEMTWDPGAGRRRRAAAAEEKRQKAIVDTNNKGVEYHKKNDFVNAIIQYEAALAQDPENEIYKKNLENARASQKFEQDVEARRDAWWKDSAVAADRVKGVMGGLSFDGAGGTPAAADGELGFSSSIPAAAAPNGDAMVVDARNVPSGLSASVERSIKAAYPDAPPAVTDRLRKGFQAVETRDWKAARAWFQDALQRDPTNAGLQRFVELTEDPAQRAKPVPQPPKGPIPASDAELAAFFSFFRDPPSHPKYQASETVRARVLNLSKDEFNRLLALQLPTDADQELLFGGR